MLVLKILVVLMSGFSKQRVSYLRNDSFVLGLKFTLVLQGWNDLVVPTFL
jgi:hypothetical protein